MLNTVPALFSLARLLVLVSVRGSLRCLVRPHARLPIHTNDVTNTIDTARHNTANTKYAHTMGRSQAQPLLVVAVVCVIGLGWYGMQLHSRVAAPPARTVANSGPSHTQPTPSGARQNVGLKLPTHSALRRGDVALHTAALETTKPHRLPPLDHGSAATGGDGRGTLAGRKDSGSSGSGSASQAAIGSSGGEHVQHSNHHTPPGEMPRTTDSSEAAAPEAPGPSHHDTRVTDTPAEAGVASAVGSGVTDLPQSDMVDTLTTVQDDRHEPADSPPSPSDPVAVTAPSVDAGAIGDAPSPPLDVLPDPPGLSTQDASSSGGPGDNTTPSAKNPDRASHVSTTKHMVEGSLVPVGEGVKANTDTRRLRPLDAPLRLRYAPPASCKVTVNTTVAGNIAVWPPKNLAPPFVWTRKERIVIEVIHIQKTGGKYFENVLMDHIVRPRESDNKKAMSVAPVACGPGCV